RVGSRIGCRRGGQAATPHHRRLRPVARSPTNLGAPRPRGPARREEPKNRAGPAQGLGNVSSPLTIGLRAIHILPAREVFEESLSAGITLPAFTSKPWSCSALISARSPRERLGV